MQPTAQAVGPRSILKTQAPKGRKKMLASFLGRDFELGRIVLANDQQANDQRPTTASFQIHCDQLISVSPTSPSRRIHGLVLGSSGHLFSRDLVFGRFWKRHKSWHVLRDHFFRE